MDALRTETTLLEQLTQLTCNVPRYVGQDREANKHILIMEYCPHDLHRIIIQKRKFHRAFSEIDILQITIDVLCVVEKLHKLNYVHMDIKPRTLSLTQTTSSSEETAPTPEDQQKVDGLPPRPKSRARFRVRSSRRSPRKRGVGISSQTSAL